MARTSSISIPARLVAVHAVVWVLLVTVFTAPVVLDVLRFDAGQPLARPWTVLTWPLVHSSPLHLLGTSILLLGLGPAVARTMGARGFLAFYAWSAAGTVVLAMVFATLTDVPPLAGALGPGLGVLLAYAWLEGDREIELAPLPIRTRRAIVVLAGASLILVGALLFASPALSIGHAGGLAAGWAWFRLRGTGPRPAPKPSLPVRRPAVTPARLGPKASAHAVPEPPGNAPIITPPPVPGPESGADEIDRLLDKISAHGMESLTSREREALAEYSERKRRERSES